MIKCLLAFSNYSMATAFSSFFPTIPQTHLMFSSLFTFTHAVSSNTYTFCLDLFSQHQLKFPFLLKVCLLYSSTWASEYYLNSQHLPLYLFLFHHKLLHDIFCTVTLYLKDRNIEDQTSFENQELREEQTRIKLLNVLEISLSNI